MRMKKIMYDIVGGIIATPFVLVDLALWPLLKLKILH